MGEGENIGCEEEREHESDDVSRTSEVGEHGDDDHADATAEAGFADTGEPCTEAEGDDFVDGVPPMGIGRFLAII